MVIVVLWKPGVQNNSLGSHPAEVSLELFLSEVSTTAGFGQIEKVLLGPESSWVRYRVVG